MIMVIDSSSDDETETPIQKRKKFNSPTTSTQERTNKQRRGHHCQASLIKSKQTKSDDTSNIYNEFIDHVVMIWLNRVQKGYKNVVMPDNILKAKAKEAAGLLDMHNKFCSNIWLTEFQQKITRMREQKQTVDIGDSKVFRIEEIIREERPKFFKNNAKLMEEKLAKELKEIEENQQKQLAKMLEEQKNHLEKVKKGQREQMEIIKEAQKQRDEAQKQQDEDLRRQEEIKILELRKALTIMKNRQDEIKIAHSKLNSVSPASATKLRFGVLHAPEKLKITEVRGAVPPPGRLSPECETVTLLEVIDVDDVLDEPIQSYQEALDCLTLVENYFLSTRNLKAVMFINQIEGFLKKQISS